MCHALTVPHARVTVVYEAIKSPCLHGIYILTGGEGPGRLTYFLIVPISVISQTQPPRQKAGQAFSPQFNPSPSLIQLLNLSLIHLFSVFP